MLITRIVILILYLYINTSPTCDIELFENIAYDSVNSNKQHNQSIEETIVTSEPYGTLSLMIVF